MPIRNNIKVSLCGDTAILTYSPSKDTHGIAWLVIEQGPMGEIGRDVTDEECPHMLEPRMLNDINGILIGAENYKSFDVVIDMLMKLRDQLKIYHANNVKVRKG